ncbi:MAG TPA: UvrD-helicase domain-containing protein [Chloroflexota bacterium]
MTDMLDSLNDRQRQAVLHSGGPILVVAGPGSGKTRVIAYRIAYLVKGKGIPRRRILGVTFTARAAEEMRGRVGQLLDVQDDLRLGTFHWFCQALLRRHGGRIGLEQGFRLLSPRESRRALRAVIEATPLEEVPLSRLWSILSAAKCGADLAAQASETGIEPHAIAAMLRSYERLIRNQRSVDLDDLLVLSARVLDEHPDVRARCCDMYDELLVDEYQDVSPAQHHLVRLLTPQSRSVCAVGDDDQAIYGWRFATSDNLRRFLTDFSDATVLTLDMTYRTTKSILRAARSLAAHNSGALKKRLETVRPAGTRPTCFAAEDEIEEANWVARTAAQLIARGVCSASDIAVLYRVHAQSRALEDAFLRHSLAYDMKSGERFFARTEIQAAMALLRLAVDEADNSAAQTLLMLISGIGPQRLRAMAERPEGPASLLAGARGPVADVSPSVASGVDRMRGLVSRVAAVRNASLPLVVDAAVTATLEMAVESPRIDFDVAAETLEELRSLAQETHAAKGTLGRLLERLNAVTGDSVVGRSINCMTLHAAKGMEFVTVFLVGLEEGLLPHRRSMNATDLIEEERRLCYVGVTRASDRLYLSYAHSRDFAARAGVVHPSRFIGEMGNINLTFESRSRRDRSMRRLSRVSRGEQVVHARWGVGTVTDVSGRGRESLATIEFAGGGTRTFQLCYAPLIRTDEARRAAI